MRDPIAIPNNLAVFSFKAWRSAVALLDELAIMFAFQYVTKRMKRMKKTTIRRRIVQALVQNKGQKLGMFERSSQE